MNARLVHQEVKEISDDHTEKSLNRPWEKGRAELKEKEIDESVKGPGMTFLHLNANIDL
jgi:hypothetical protein